MQEINGKRLSKVKFARGKNLTVEKKGYKLIGDAAEERSDDNEECCCSEKPH